MEFGTRVGILFVGLLTFAFPGAFGVWGLVSFYSEGSELFWPLLVSFSLGVPVAVVLLASEALFSES